MKILEGLVKRKWEGYMVSLNEQGISVLLTPYKVFFFFYSVYSSHFKRENKCKYAKIYYPVFQSFRIRRQLSKFAAYHFNTRSETPIIIKLLLQFVKNIIIIGGSQAK